MARPHINLAIFVLSLVGCFISLFLTVKYVQNADIPCTRGSSDCNAVANDSAAWGLGIASLRRIPTPAFGLLMYAGIGALSLVRVVCGRGVISRKASTLQWLLSLAGVGVSGYLTWREAAIIHRWCEWCVGSAIIVLILFILASAERQSPSPTPPAERLEVT